MVTLTKLADAEYLLESVVLGVEEYYVGVGEAPGVWSGRWAGELGLVGMVEADELRSLLDGVDPVSGEGLTVGLPDRKVRAVDVTFSAPKSVSVLWALGSGPVADAVMQAHGEAVATALGFLEGHASVARRQVDGVRGRVATEGLAVAGFVHRTSREGDPQLHSHCLTVNLTRRVEDGRVVALDCWPLYGWARAAGSVYQAELQRSLSLRLGVEWGPDRSNTREIAGFEPGQLRVFSKRSALIEAELERMGAAGVADPGVRARLDDVASLATRAAKDRGLTPNALVDRWKDEAARTGLPVGGALDRAVCFGAPDVEAPSFETLAGLLVDPDAGLCARSARFSEADVVEHLCAHAAGRLALEEIEEYAFRFLSSDAVVRLVPKAEGRGMREWSTVAHRALEDRVVALVDQVASRHRPALADAAVLEAAEVGVVLGADQREAVGVVCGAGGGVRCVLAPAGFGKTAMVATGSRVAAGAGRPVLGVATTAKAVAELDGAGVDSMTIAALRRAFDRDGPLEEGTVLVLDEVSQASTRDAETVLAAVAGCTDGELWVLGDPRQGQPVLAGGLADHLAGKVAAGEVPGGVLVENRRQVDGEDREALRLLRDGGAEASQTIRTEQGWEHDCGSPSASRDNLADTAVADMGRHGPDRVAVLCVSHSDAEDLANRIRHRLTADGVIRGPALEGQGWAGPRQFQEGDRVLFHTRYAGRDSGIVNGTTATIESVEPTGLTVRLDTKPATRHSTRPDTRPDQEGDVSRVVIVEAGFVVGTRPDGSPNLSHAWARTIDGAQGGTWQTAHLLGTPALDQYRGYVGQSRSREPTHTWNTTPAPAVDHGGIPADDREPAEQVLVALNRTPDASLAANSDPYTLDRELRTLIDEHEAVLADRPPDQTEQIAAAEGAVDHAQLNHAAATGQLDQARASRDNVNPLGLLTREGRAERRVLDLNIEQAQQQYEDTLTPLTEAEAALTRALASQTDRADFDRAEGWRSTEVVDLQRRLDDHWAHVAVTCAQADDPLAYGVDVLRRSLAHHTDRLDLLDQQIPPDRSRELTDARHDLAAAVDGRDRASQDLRDARNRLEAATASRWRAQPIETAAAQADIGISVGQLRDFTTVEVRLRPVVDQLTQHQQARQAIIDAVAPEQGELTRSTTVLRNALESTLHDRVEAMVLDPPEHLVRALGALPETDDGRDAWRRHAAAIEHRIDTGALTPGTVRHDIHARWHISIANNPLPPIPASPTRTLDSTPLPGRLHRGTDLSL